MEHVLRTRNAETRIVVEQGSIDRIGQHIRHLLPEGVETQVAVITDYVVGRIYGERVLHSLHQSELRAICHEVPDGESSKCVDQLAGIYRALTAAGIDRNGLILSLGGGMVSDLAGLAAGTWMRGVRHVICPTSLEAMIDASIGGKTGINLPEGKNLVGVFHHPGLVVMDPDTLATLSPRDFRAALAESIKHALVASEVFFAWHESHATELSVGSRPLFAALIERNVRIKCDIVDADERETGTERVKLNFGHTLGHAIEVACDYALRHGESVGLGMLASVTLSEQLGLLREPLRRRLEALLSSLELPVRLAQNLAFEPLFEIMRRDKKNQGGGIRMVLLESVGRPVILEKVSESYLRSAFETLLPEESPSRGESP